MKWWDFAFLKVVQLYAIINTYIQMDIDGLHSIHRFSVEMHFIILSHFLFLPFAHFLFLSYSHIFSWRTVNYRLHYGVNAFNVEQRTRQCQWFLCTLHIECHYTKDLTIVAIMTVHQMVVKIISNKHSFLLTFTQTTNKDQLLPLSPPLHVPSFDLN